LINGRKVLVSEASANKKEKKKRIKYVALEKKLNKAKVRKVDKILQRKV